MTFIFPEILGMSSSQLTFIFFRGVGQPPTINSIQDFLWAVGEKSPSLPGGERGRHLEHDYHFDGSGSKSFMWEVGIAKLVKIDPRSL